MAQYILVIDGDETATQWIAVAIAPTSAQLYAMPCYDRNNPVILAKADYVAVLDRRIQIGNCATPGDPPENGTIYALTPR